MMTADERKRMLKDLPENFPIPYGKTIFLVKESGEKKTQSGIIVPDMGTKEQGQHTSPDGVVVGIGDDVIKNIKPGDRIMFNGYANMHFIFDDRVVYMLSEVDVYAKLPSKDTITGTHYFGAPKEEHDIRH